MSRALAFITSLIAALLCGPAFAQTPASCPPAAQPPSADQLRALMRDARDHGFLWRISKGGRSSWLYGTLHVAKLDWALPGPKVTAALKASDTIALEIDMLDADNQRLMMQGLSAAPAGTPLPDGASLPRELKDRLQRRTEAECLPWSTMQALPLAFHVAALDGVIARREGLDPAYGIDLTLAGWGREAQLPVVSLESVALQLKALQPAGTAAETLEFVGHALDELDNGGARSVLLHIAQIWADGDWRALADYESWCDCLKTAADRAEMARMLDERNPGMAAGIDKLHASGQRVFAAVGSLHMIGPTGLPTLMARRGYRVERIDYKKTQETP